MKKQTKYKEWTPRWRPKKKTASDLALEFKVIQEQIRDSHGYVKKELEKERDKIVKQYKKMKKVI